jgi:predicted nucleic acid-binding protein
MDMVIVDTSIWVTHLRKSTRQLEKLLMDAEVMCHPFIIGELACGNLKNRNEIISLLQSLPMAPTIEFDEFLFFIDRNHLMGKGIGFVDIHLLASARLIGVLLWTADKRLKSAADLLELAYKK